jgi:hypothetical protein
MLTGIGNCSKSDQNLQVWKRKTKKALGDAIMPAKDRLIRL